MTHTNHKNKPPHTEHPRVLKDLKKPHTELTHNVIGKFTVSQCVCVCVFFNGPLTPVSKYVSLEVLRLPHTATTPEIIAQFMLWQVFAFP